MSKHHHPARDEVSPATGNFEDILESEIAHWKDVNSNAVTYTDRRQALVKVNVLEELQEKINAR